MEVLFIIDAVGHHQSLLNSTLLHWIRTNPIKNCDHSNREDVSLKLNARKRVDLFDGILTQKYGLSESKVEKRSIKENALHEILKKWNKIDYFADSMERSFDSIPERMLLGLTCKGHTEEKFAAIEIGIRQRITEFILREKQCIQSFGDRIFGKNDLNADHGNAWNLDMRKPEADNRGRHARKMLQNAGWMSGCRANQLHGMVM